MKKSQNQQRINYIEEINIKSDGKKIKYYQIWKNYCKLSANFRVVRHVRLHWNSWQWNDCFMYESFKNTELPEKKC